MKRGKLHDSEVAPRSPTGRGPRDLDDRASDKLLDRYAPAEPDDLAVERVWHRLLNTVSTSNTAREKVPFGVLAPAVLASVIFAGLLLTRRTAHREPPRASPEAIAAVSSSAELSAAIGGVFFTHPAESWVVGRSRQALAKGDRLRSDASGMAVLDVPGVASVLIGSGADVVIDRLAGGTFLRLSRGSVVARVSKRPPGQPFVVLTDRFAVKVVGTLFEVDQDGSGRTAVSVREGTVEVASADGTTYRVEAGQRWLSAEPGKRGASAIADSIKTLLEAGGRGANPADLERELEAVGRSSALTTAGQPQTTPKAAVGLVDPPVMPKPDSPSSPRIGSPETREKEARALAAREARRLSEAPSQPPPNFSANLSGGTAALPPPIVLAEREPNARERQSLTVAPAASVTPLAMVDSAYTDGLALERRGDFDAAAAKLARAAEKDPSHADLALYALGRLFQRRLNDPQRALDAFERYRTRYPHGSLTQETDLAVLEIDVQTGDRRGALAESMRFLATHPASERTAEVHVLRGNLLRGAGDCRTALGEYVVVDSSAFAEAALFGTARCQQELGNVAAAREALRAYQTRFPAGPHRDEVARDLAEGTGQ